MNTELEELTKAVADKVSERHYIAAPFLTSDSWGSVRILLPDGDFHTVRFSAPKMPYADNQADAIAKEILGELRAYEQKRSRRSLGQEENQGNT